MAKRLIMIGLGSQAALAVIGFMLLAGSPELPALARIPAMVALLGWSVALALILLLTHRAWERLSQAQRFGIGALALPGWTVGLPLVMLYLMRPRDGEGWLAADD